ncbi:proteinase B [Martiniozyma asiatica (nom. inval.)]|nr:proteinase B [Martiniozyma asiatica]
MKLSKSISLSVVAALAASNVSALVIPELKDLPAAIAAKDATVEHVEATHVEKPQLNSIVDLNSEEESVNVYIKENAIPNSYIVLLKDSVSDEQFNFHQLWVNDIQVQSFAILDTQDADAFKSDLSAMKFETENGGIGHVYSSAGFKGYSGMFTSEVIEILRLHPDVAHIEQDSEVYAIDASTQTGAPWGLSRISHRKSLGLGNYNKYIYDSIAGDGVTAYVIDTGVNVDHKSFGGRATWGATIPSGDADSDGNGHGTHCAGTIGSEDYGVSKNADIVAVKVLRSNGSGSMSDVVKGVEFAANSHIKASKNAKKGFKGSTANMSLGGGKSPALDQAVNAAVSAGLHFAVAAGNDNADACNYSPAAANKAITVGASTLSDSRAYFSNYGKCVDIFAPGLNILSTYIGSESATAILSGTSMASPHVCGLLTYFLSLAPTSDSLFASGAITPAQLKENIIKYGTRDILTDIPTDTPNNLIFNGAGGDLADFWHATSVMEAATPGVESVEESIDSVKDFVENHHHSIKEELFALVEEAVEFSKQF